MTIKIIIALSIGIILIGISLTLYWMNKRNPNSKMKLKKGLTQWFLASLPLIFLISGILVILFGCLNFNNY